jgi:hypothetical protein
MVDPEDGRRLSKPIALKGRTAEDAARQHLRSQVLKDRANGFDRDLRPYYDDTGWR